MALSLAQTQAVAELGDLLYDFLPGSSQWSNVYTLAHAARECGVSEFWQGGSKRPALVALLETTFDRRSTAFTPLILRIVREGIKYRKKKGNPITQQDIRSLNRALLKLKLQLPELVDASFIESLPTAPAVTTSSSPVPTVVPAQQETASARAAELVRLSQLREEFTMLAGLQDRKAAGLSLERLLQSLFSTFNLHPTQPFRVIGEQIDGAFVLDSGHYLLEAKWEFKKVPEADLLVFRGKVEGKSAMTRGLFISINGFSQEAIAAIVTGKQPNFIMMDGAHLFRVLDGSIALDDLLRRMVGSLARTGRPYVSISELV